MLFACGGECPKHRFLKTHDGEEGLNYLCTAYQRFFHHTDPYMKTMAHCCIAAAGLGYHAVGELISPLGAASAHAADD